MKRDLYDRIVAYIVENQNKFYRLVIQLCSESGGCSGCSPEFGLQGIRAL